MNKATVLLIFSLFKAGMLLASEKTEPPLGYTLMVENEKVRINPGEEKQLSGTFTNPKIKLIPDDFRQFTHGGFNFKYPANFTFEADLNTPGVKIWTLTGIDILIIIQEYTTEKTTPTELVAELKKSYGPDTKISDITRVFNGKTLTGKRLFVKIANTNLIQDVLSIPTAKGSRILLLQDSPASEKNSTQETRKTLKLLDDTLKY